MYVPGWIETFLITADLTILVYFALIHMVLTCLSVLTYVSLRRYLPGLKSFDVADAAVAKAAPPITVLAPAYNEGPNCVEATHSLLALDYPNHEIIVINDGSTDETLPRLIEAFELKPGPRVPTAELPTAEVREVYQSQRHPNLWVIDKENGGKADALNAGINFCITPLFLAVDADSLLERDALLRIVRPFLTNASTMAAGGMIRVVNDCSVRYGVVTEVKLPKKLLARLQALEYLRAFLMGRVGWAAIDALLVISGAFGLFRRSAVVSAGGYASSRTSGETVGEDMELVVRLRRWGKENGVPVRVDFVPDAVAWTEVPETLSALARQRDRWQRGLWETAMRHMPLLFNPRYGFVGMVAFPYFVFLELLGSVVEVIGYVAVFISIVLGLTTPAFLIVFTVAVVAVGLVLTFFNLLLEELAFRRYERTADVFQLFLLAFVDSMGMRQLSSYWRFRGVINALLRRRSWGKQERRGFTTKSKPSGLVPGTGDTSTPAEETMDRADHPDEAALV